MTTNLSQKFRCEVCDYTCSKKQYLTQHLSTLKHFNATKNQLTQSFLCDTCDTTFKHQSSYCRHKKTCKITANNDDLILFLIKENAEFKNMLMDQHKDHQNMMMKVIENGTTNNIHNTTTNSHNKAFNLNFFLNETCKDAMNMSDFVESIKLQVSDLERIGELGYVEGITSIITSNLKALDITKRPVHCTDKKRETMYIKDENKWTKDDENKSILRNVVKKVSNKNIRILPQFKEKYPDYNNAYSKQSDMYDKMIIEVMSTQAEKEDKIIRNISRNVIIDR